MFLISQNTQKYVAQSLILIVFCFLISTQYIFAQDDISCSLNTDYLELARHQHTSGSFELAIESITCALLKDELTSEIYMYRGVMYLATEQPTEALVDFTRAIEIDNSIPHYYYSRGISYSMLQEVELAIEEFTKAIDLDSSNADFYFALAEIYMQLENVEHAEQILNQAIDNNPADAKAYAQRGYFYYTLEEYDKSEDDFITAIELDPMIASIYFNKGTVEYSVNSLDLAVTSYTIAILIELEFVEAYRQRAIAYIKLGETEKANDDIEYAFTIDNDPKYYSAFAYAYSFLGDLENSLKYFHIYQSLVDDDEIDEFTLEIIEALEEALDSE